MKKIKVKRFICFALATVMIFGLFTGMPVSSNDVPTLDEWIANTYDATSIGLLSDLTPRYGSDSNGKFLAPIEPPVEGSIPISNRAELEAIKDNLSGNYHLTADIDLSGTEWIPIGGASKWYWVGNDMFSDDVFSGIFDGQGYIIKNLTISNEYTLPYALGGLFGSTVGAIIINVGLEETYINISFNNYNVEENHIGAMCVGGISGYSKSTSIINSYNMGLINITVLSYPQNWQNFTSEPIKSVHVGGITGFQNLSAGVISCFNSVSITVTGGDYTTAGGLVGFINRGTVMKSYNMGAVSVYSQNSTVGGIVASKIDSEILWCFNTGSIMASSDFSSNAGGVVGYSARTGLIGGVNIPNIIGSYNMGTIGAFSDKSSSAGGICGYLQGGGLRETYNTGMVSASAISNAKIGGLVVSREYLGSNNMSNNYWCIESKQIKNDNELEDENKKGVAATADLLWDDSIFYIFLAQPLTSAQMKDAANFVGFDFDTVWDINPSVNDGYPFLRNMTIIEGGDDPDEILTKNGSFTYSAGHIDKNVVSGGEKGNYTTDYYYSDSFFEDTSYNYRQDLAAMSLCLSMAAFGKYGGSYSEKDQTIVNLLEDIGFDEKHIDTTLGYGEEPTVDSIGAAIALKPLPTNDGKDTVLLTVAVRGGEYKSEWGNNFYLGKNDVHQGFFDSRHKVINAISAFLDEHGDKLSGKRVKLWIVGYSRGSAVANLLGAFFNDLAFENNGQIRDFYLGNENIYTYGFAVPAATREDGTDSTLYKNIFSIVSANDFVTRFAPGVKGQSLTSKWEYKRYGVTLSIPTVETIGAKHYTVLENAMLQQFTKFDKSSTEKFTAADYLINDFAKHIGFIKPSPPYIGIGNKLRYQLPQSIWLDDLINIAAIEIFYSPAVYVNRYQKIIMDAMVDFGRGNDINIDGIIDALLWDIIFLAVTDINRYSDYAATLMANVSNLIQAHYPEIYLAWMNSFLTDPALCSEWLDLVNVKYRIVHVNCPVDIEVYDSDNNLIASIVNDESQRITDSSIYAGLDENGQKTIYLLADEEYTIKITAADNGEMTYSVQEFDRNESSVTRVVNYYEIKIQKGDTLTGIIEILTEENNANYTLIGNDNEEIEPSEVFNNINEVESYEVSVEITGNGNVTGEGIRIKGEFAILTAYPAEREQFLGWYKDGEAISSEINYRFCVLSNTTLEARFTTTTIIKGDLNDDGKADIEDAKIYLESLVGNTTLTPTQELAVNLAVGEYDNDDSSIKKLRKFLQSMNTAELPQVPTPQNLAWSDTQKGTMEFDAVPEAEGLYVLTVYKENEKLFSTNNWSVQQTGRVTINFANFILGNGTGTYTFTVQARGVTGISSDSEVSELSPPYVYVKPFATLDVPTGLMWDSANHTARWNAVTNEQVDVTYFVELYLDDGNSKDLQVFAFGFSQPFYDFSRYTNQVGDYTFKVSALSSNIEVVTHGEWSTESPVYKISEIEGNDITADFPHDKAPC